MAIQQFIRQAAKQLKQGNFSALSALPYYNRWADSLKEGKNALADKQPWITFPAIDRLNGFLDRNSKVFEYGGGGSTLFFTDRVAETITVEHDKAWFTSLEQLIGNSPKWKGRLITPEPLNGSREDPADPEAFYSDDASFKGYEFRKYVTAIDNYPDGYFDLVMVDGRARTSCIHYAHKKIRKGGWLVLDNSDRTYYTINNQALLHDNFRLELDAWSLVPYLNHFSKTTIWSKTT
jgi:hypothetical protein